MERGPLTRRPTHAQPTIALLLAMAFVVPAVRAAEQPLEAPGDFRNGQGNAFGSIAMAPYLPVQDAPVPIEARIVLHDLETLRAAASVLFAFNLKGEAAVVTLESVSTSSGDRLAPTTTVTVDDGRQPQAHIAPADLLRVAQDGRVDLVLAGRVEAKANGQSHVGAMVIAFDEAWDILPSGDGPAQLYGFTMAMATGLGGGAMPFQGQGNTWLLLPVALLAFIAAMAGGMAARVAFRLAPAPLPPRPVAAARRLPPAAAPRPVPVFGGPASSASPSPPAPSVRPAVQQLGVPFRPLPPTGATATAVAAAPPPATLPAAPAPPPPTFPVGPLQGPLLPSHPLRRSTASLRHGSPGVAARSDAPARPAPSTARVGRPSGKAPAAHPKSAKTRPPTAGKAPATMARGAPRQASR